MRPETAFCGRAKQSSRAFPDQRKVAKAFEALIYPEPSFAQHSPVMVQPPPGAGVVDDWYLFWVLPHRLGLQLSLNGEDLNMVQARSTTA